MSTDTSAQSASAVPAEPPFRYNARLAGEIEQRWQDRWEQEGTFHAQPGG